MPWTVTDANYFNTFDNGDFEGGAGTAKAGVTDGMAQYGFSALQAHKNSQSYRVFLSNSASFSESGNVASRSLVSFRIGKELKKDRRYTFTGWFKIVSTGKSKSGDIVKLRTSIGSTGFGSQGLIIGDLRADVGVWKQFTYIGTITSNTITADKASINFVFTWDKTQVGFQSAADSTIENVDIFFDDFSAIEEANIVVPPPATLSVNSQVTNESAANLNDGQIKINVTSGSGQYTVTYPDASVFNLSNGNAAQSHTRTNLSAGEYTIVIKDLTTNQERTLNVTITEPQIEEPIPLVGSFLEVPKMNSITFVVQEDINQCDNPQGLDNVLLCQQEYEMFEQTKYDQKFNRCDIPITQFNSDYSTFEILLKKYLTGAIVKTFSYSLKEQNIGVYEDYAVTIRAHAGNPSQSRVYFNVGALPLPLEIAGVFEVVNNINGYNGSYSIVNIINDITLGYQYLVINKPFIGPGFTQAGTGRFMAATADFNVFESTHPFSDVDEGIYYIAIKAFDFVGSENFKEAVSEPIDLRNIHSDTNLIKYRNTDNAFDITWTTGYQGLIRVPSYFGHKRVPGGERSVNRNSDYKLVKVSAKKTRILIFEIFKVPPYMHEKLSTAFDCDSYTINNIECQASEGYAEPEYKDQLLLADSSIKVEAKWYDRYNSDDLGSVNETGFLLTETGFIKR